MFIPFLQNSDPAITIFLYIAFFVVLYFVCLWLALREEHWWGSKNSHGLYSSLCFMFIYPLYGLFIGLPKFIIDISKKSYKFIKNKQGNN